MAERRGEEEENIKSEALEIINLFPNLPRLLVFDLDYTLWPFFCECYDEDDMPWLYPQARGILCALKDKGIEMAVASRSPTSNVATAFLAKLDIQSMFVVQLDTQDRTLPEDTHEDRNTIFDDEYRNIEAVSKMGVTCILVDRGLNLEALKQGLTNFSRKSLGMNGRN